MPSSNTPDARQYARDLLRRELMSMQSERDSQMEYARMIGELAPTREAGDVYQQVEDRAVQHSLEIGVIQRLAERIQRDASDELGAAGDGQAGTSRG